MRLSLELLLLNPKFALLLLGIFMAAEDADDVDDEAEVPLGLVDPSNILVLNMVYHTDIPSRLQIYSR